MKELLGGNATITNVYCQQKMGGYGCTGYCEPIFDLPNHTTRPRNYVEIGKMPPDSDEEMFSICGCV